MHISRRGGRAVRPRMGESGRGGRGVGHRNTGPRNEEDTMRLMEAGRFLGWRLGRAVRALGGVALVAGLPAGASARGGDPAKIHACVNTALLGLLGEGGV